MVTGGAKAATGGFHDIFNEELNKKGPREEPRQPGEDFMIFLIKNKKGPREDPRQPNEDFMTF